MNVSSACVRSGSSRFRLMYDSTVGADFKRRSWSAHGSEDDGHRTLGLRLAIVCRWLHNYDVTYVRRRKYIPTVHHINPLLTDVFIMTRNPLGIRENKNSHVIAESII